MNRSSQAREVKFKASKQKNSSPHGSTSLAAALWCVAVKWSCKSTQKQPGGVNVVSYTSKLQLRQGGEKHDETRPAVP